MRRTGQRDVEAWYNPYNPYKCRTHRKILKWGGRIYYCSDCCTIDGVIPAHQEQ